MGAFSHKFSIAPIGETTDPIKKMLRGEKNACSSSITIPSMVEIVGRAPAVNQKVWCFYRQTCAKRNHAGIVFTLWSPKMGDWRHVGGDTFPR